MTECAGRVALIDLANLHREFGHGVRSSVPAHAWPRTSFLPDWLSWQGHLLVSGSSQHRRSAGALPSRSKCCRMVSTAAGTCQIEQAHFNHALAASPCAQPGPRQGSNLYLQPVRANRSSAGRLCSNYLPDDLAKHRCCSKAVGANSDSVACTWALRTTLHAGQTPRRWYSRRHAASRRRRRHRSAPGTPIPLHRSRPCCCRAAHRLHRPLLP